MTIKILYAFPEPLPLPKARGIQVAWTVDSLCSIGVHVALAYVSTDNAHPLLPLGKSDYPENLKLVPTRHHWPFPFHRWHSVTRFARSLLRWVARDPLRIPDAIFVRHVKLAFRLMKARPDIPVIYEAHEWFAATAPKSKRAALAKQEAYVLEHASGIVFISRAVQEALTNAYSVGGKQIVLHSAVDLPRTERRKDWENCRRHIIYAGSFFGWKGVDDLIDAAALLPDHRISLVGGDADEIARLQQKVSPKGAEIVFLPRLPANQVMEHLQNACIAVLPNRPEGVSQFTSPLKLFESMAAGCAIVASDLPSLREVLPTESASWCSPGNPTSLAAAIQRLTCNPALARTQGQALRQIAESYTWTARAKLLTDFVGSILH